MSCVLNLNPSYDVFMVRDFLAKLLQCGKPYQRLLGNDLVLFNILPIVFYLTLKDDSVVSWNVEASSYFIFIVHVHR